MTAGTVTGEVTESAAEAVGGRQVRRAAAATAIAVAAVVTLMVAGGPHRVSGLVFLLPTLAVVAVLIATPFLVPRGRTRTPVYRFRITEVSGRVLDCEILGKLDGAPLRAGDGVEVFGRPGAVVRVDEIVRGDERLHGRPPVAFQIARHAATVALALATACAVGVGVLVVFA